MNAGTASLINAVLLIALSLWGYFSAVDPSPTAFIPTVIGVLLLLMNGGVRKENKVIAHIAVLLTVVVLFGLAMPLMGSMKRGDNMGLLRVGIMLLSTVFALVYFVKSFIAAKKARQ